ncbi:MAG: hypothetical protein GWN01_12110, partial [Nitrosopumilaceae archaeon]|nr:hypothetical protein [Nitrosopumilaceae archaeon]NIX62222.1 hypothetical protein [Nitrosopumilaceae archaeon]
HGIKATNAVGNSAFLFVPEVHFEEVSHIVKGMVTDEFGNDGEEATRGVDH